MTVEPPDDIAFVYALYRGILNRVPDAPGLKFYTRELAEGRLTRHEVAMAFLRSNEYLAKRTVELGKYKVPVDWPLKGESARSFERRFRTGLFSNYMSGDVILDIGYRGQWPDAVPILPHAIGVDLGFPGYDGKRLPFPDESVDTVFSSHMLEHSHDPQTVIRDWYRVLKFGGFIVMAVPHQYLYERKRWLPSVMNADHKRFYTPASLCREFEDALEPNSYRVRHLCDNDQGYNYDIGPPQTPTGAYEIECVIEKRRKPAWEFLE